MPAVNSSNIASVDYDPDKLVLTVVFRSGRTYRYDNVPQGEYDNLLNASSVGKYFAQNIKDAYSWS